MYFPKSLTNASVEYWYADNHYYFERTPIQKRLGYNILNTAEQNMVVILGGGTGGLVAAVQLKKKLGKLARIILIDKNPNHVYSPSFLWLMLGKRSAGQIQKPLAKLGRKGIEFVCDEIVRINVESKIVVTNQRSIS